MKIINEQNQKQPISLNSVKELLLKRSNGAFITVEILDNLELHDTYNEASSSFCQIKMFALEHNEKIYMDLIKNNSSLGPKNIKDGDLLSQMKKAAFEKSIQRQGLMEKFHTMIQNNKNKKYYQLDDSLGKLMFALLLTFNCNINGGTLNEMFEQLESFYEIYHLVPYSFLENYYNLILKIRQSNLDGQIWNEIDKKQPTIYDKSVIKNCQVELISDLLKKKEEESVVFNNLNDKQIFDRFVQMNALVTRLIGSFRAKQMYLFYIDYVDSNLSDLLKQMILTIKCQDIYRECKINTALDKDLLENELRNRGYDRLQNRISLLQKLYVHDQIVIKNYNKLCRWINNLNGYIRIKDIEKFQHYLQYGSPGLEELLNIALIQNEEYNERALKEYELSKSAKPLKSKTTSISQPTKEQLIHSFNMTEVTQQILSTFSIEKVQYILSCVKNQSITVEFIENNINDLQNRYIYRNFKQNIKLLNNIVGDIVRYNGKILFEDTKILKDRLIRYTDYKLSIEGLTNYEFLLNDDVFNIIEAFRSLGYFKVIKAHPEYISVNSENIIKRLRIASIDSSMTVVNDDLYFNDDIVTGEGFPIADDELDKYIHEFSLTDKVTVSHRGSYVMTFDNKSKKSIMF